MKVPVDNQEGCSSCSGAGHNFTAMSCTPTYLNSLISQCNEGNRFALSKPKAVMELLPPSLLRGQTCSLHLAWLLQMVGWNPGSESVSLLLCLKPRKVMELLPPSLLRGQTCSLRLAWLLQMVGWNPGSESVSLLLYLKPELTERKESHPEETNQS